MHRAARSADRRPGGVERSRDSRAAGSTPARRPHAGSRETRECLSDGELAVVQRAPDTGAGQARGARGAQIVERAHATRHDDIETELGELPGSIDIGSRELPVACDFVINDRADSQPPDARRQLPRRELQDLGSAAPAWRDVAPLRVDAHGETRRAMAGEESCDEATVDAAARADHDARGTQREHLIDVDLAKQPAADLDPDLRRTQHRSDELVIVLSSVGAVHVDEVNPPRARARERVERRQRLRHGAEGARHAPAFYVNGGIELHGKWYWREAT